jgi:hypothetical protein
LTVGEWRKFPAISLLQLELKAHAAHHTLTKYAYFCIIKHRIRKEVHFMYERDHVDPFLPQDPRRSVQTPLRSKSLNIPVFQQSFPEMSVKGHRADSLTRQLLLKEQRQKQVRGYKEIFWQQRTMDDSSLYDIDALTFLDDEL